MEECDGKDFGYQTCKSYLPGYVQITTFVPQGKSSVCVNDIILYATHIRDESKNVCFRGTVKGAGLVESCFYAVCVILFYVPLDKIDYFVK